MGITHSIFRIVDPDTGFASEKTSFFPKPQIILPVQWRILPSLAVCLAPGYSETGDHRQYSLYNSADQYTVIYQVRSVSLAGVAAIYPWARANALKKNQFSLLGGMELQHLIRVRRSTSARPEEGELDMTGQFKGSAAGYCLGLGVVVRQFEAVLLYGSSYTNVLKEEAGVGFYQMYVKLAMGMYYRL
jgi:hypothetical protein